MSEETTKMICITCPVGCPLTVTYRGQTIIQVEGHRCQKGLDYAKTEFTNPRRVVTSTVKANGGIHPLVPVYTAAPVPKPLIFDLLDALRQVQIKAPVRMGQVVLKDALGTGVDVLASRDLPPV